MAKYPLDFEKPGDLAFTTGINRFCFHSFIHQPVDIAVPGFTMGRYGTLFSRHSTWWEMGQEWIEYLTRCQYLLQQGRRVTDICFLFNQEVRYAFPDSLVNVPSGYDYSIIYPQDLVNAQSLQGDLKLQSGSIFKLIILPNNMFIEPSVAKNLIELVKDGCLLVCSQQSLDLLGIDDSHSKGTEYLLEMGNGSIFVNTPIQNAVKQMDLQPDVDTEGFEYSKNIFFTHRETAEEHIYFISNQTENAFDIDVGLKINGLIPQRWDPTIGIVEEKSTIQEHQQYSNYSTFFRPLWLSICGLCQR
jgi:hypothetical protein